MRLRLDDRCQRRAKNKNETAQKSASSMYSRASCEYQIMNGLSATNAAASSPARRDTRSRPHRYATGISAVPASTDSDRMPASDVPNTFAHGHASTKNSGGFGSPWLIDRSIAPNDMCNSRAASASSSQKL